MDLKISIVVPNFNGAEFLEECLESIAGQDYDGLELLLIDGGSTDHSLEIVKRFSDRIAVFVSEPDKGQSDAINKGLKLATGGVIAYVNSDDVLEPGSLKKVRDSFRSNPGISWLAGGCRVFGNEIETWYLNPEGWDELANTVLPWSRPQRYVFPQSGASFMTRDLVQQLGPYDQDLHYSMDMEYYARAAFANHAMCITPDVLAGWRWHAAAKSWMRGCAYGFRKDEVAILQKYLPCLPSGQRVNALKELTEQQWLALLREANFWSERGNRKQSLELLYEAARMNPFVLARRPWLGGLRRALTS